ncbi:hypothetical protein E2C01_059080 [Portunus trituberculatus]|uniref:Uncharacterized protein n=1 Tax=Portunus trituberculatus TaxID=210409 RepID=A0A5B7H7D0_PORTR|nr:hypothetical protein [Portunus trituberculatus]
MEVIPRTIITRCVSGFQAEQRNASCSAKAARVSQGIKRPLPWLVRLELSHALLCTGSRKMGVGGKGKRGWILEVWSQMSESKGRVSSAVRHVWLVHE